MCAKPSRVLCHIFRTWGITIKLSGSAGMTLQVMVVAPCEVPLNQSLHSGVNFNTPCLVYVNESQWLFMKYSAFCIKAKENNDVTCINVPFSMTKKFCKNLSCQWTFVITDSIITNTQEAELFGLKKMFHLWVLVWHKVTCDWKIALAVWRLMSNTSLSLWSLCLTIQCM